MTWLGVLQAERGQEVLGCLGVGTWRCMALASGLADRRTTHVRGSRREGGQTGSVRGLRTGNRGFGSCVTTSVMRPCEGP